MTFQKPIRGLGDNHDGAHGLDDAAVAALQTLYDELLSVPSEEASIKDLKAHERLVAQRNAALMALVRMTRRNSGIDSGPAIVVAISALSDNRHGRATVSTTRLARFLKRDPRSIERRIAALIDEGILGRIADPGRGAATWVLVSTVHAALKPTEMLAVIAPPVARGRPKITGMGHEFSEETPGTRRRGERETPDTESRGDEKSTGTERRGYSENAPTLSAGGVEKTPGTSHKNPRHGSEKPPARGLSEAIEIAREALHITASIITARENTDGSGAIAPAADALGCYVAMSNEALLLGMRWREIFRPTRTSTTALTDDARKELARALFAGRPDGAYEHVLLAVGDSDERLSAPRTTALAALCAERFPSCRIEDALAAIASAKMEAIALQVELEGLADLLKGFPPDGVIASSEQLQALANPNEPEEVPPMKGDGQWLT